MIKPITLFQHFPWNVHLIRNDHRKLRLRLSLSLTIDWNMIVCSRTTAIVASEMCIEYRTIYNSIGRVWEIPDTGITDCQAVDIRSHPVYHLSTCRIISICELFCFVRYFGHPWAVSLHIAHCQDATNVVPGLRPISCVHSHHYSLHTDTAWHQRTSVYVYIKDRLSLRVNVNIYNLTIPISIWCYTPQSQHKAKLSCLDHWVELPPLNCGVCVRGGSEQLRGGLLMCWRYQRDALGAGSDSDSIRSLIKY